MNLPQEIADDIRRSGAVVHLTGFRIGLRKAERAWFNRSSGHYVIDCGNCFMWSGDGMSPWRVVPETEPCALTLGCGEKG